DSLLSRFPGAIELFSLSLHDALPISHGHEDGVVLGLELGPGHVDADIGRRDELDAFGLHDGQAAIDDLLLELEVGDPVAQQAARSEEHTSELQSRENLVCRLLLEKKK